MVDTPAVKVDMPDVSPVVFGSSTVLLLTSGVSLAIEVTCAMLVVMSIVSPVIAGPSVLVPTSVVSSVVNDSLAVVKSDVSHVVKASDVLVSDVP